MKEKIDKLDFNKIKNFYSTEDLVIDFFFFKASHRLGEKTCNHISNNKKHKYLEISKILKTQRWGEIPNQKRAKDMKRHVTKRIYRWQINVRKNIQKYQLLGNCTLKPQ